MQNGSPMLHSILSRYLPDGRAGSGFFSPFAFSRLQCRSASVVRCAALSAASWTGAAAQVFRLAPSIARCTAVEESARLPFLSEAATETIGGVTAEQSAVSRGWFFGAFAFASNEASKRRRSLRVQSLPAPAPSSAPRNAKEGTTLSCFR